MRAIFVVKFVDFTRRASRWALYTDKGCTCGGVEVGSIRTLGHIIRMGKKKEK